MLSAHRQPIANASAVDVRRVVERDYPSQLRTALAVLDQYGSEPWHKEIARVRLAALKLASRDISALQAHVNVACRDFRDVLSSAEYPAYSGAPPTLGPDDVQALLTADRRAYDAWLRG